MAKSRHDADRHHRHSIRLVAWNYATPAAYFVTICVKDPETTLGEVVQQAMVLSPFGRVAADAWRWLAGRYPYVELDEWVVMPTHLHGILVIQEQEPAAEPIKIKPLGRLVGAFKTVSTKEINLLREAPEARFWQRGYYDRVIRGPTELDAIRRYIRNNPARWAADRENLDALVARMRYVE
jgi:putative transposase